MRRAGSNGDRFELRDQGELAQVAARRARRDAQHPCDLVEGQPRRVRLELFAKQIESTVLRKLPGRPADARSLGTRKGTDGHRGGTAETFKAAASGRASLSCSGPFPVGDMRGTIP